MVPAILFYDVVVAVHVAAIVIAFGVTFAFPFIDSQLTRLSPQSLPAWYRTRAALDAKFVTPAMGLALVAGIYAASDRDLFSKVWVTVPMVILIALFGLVGAVFTPTDRKLADVAERDLTASPAGGQVTWSAEYQALSKRLAGFGTLAGVLILTAIFFMVTKPGGY
jgi:hypothetical protein